MTIIELLPRVHALSKADKLCLMQFLVTELAQEEGINLLSADGEYPIWTPQHAFEAADTLLNALKEEQITYGQ